MFRQLLASKFSDRKLKKMTPPPLGEYEIKPPMYCDECAEWAGLLIGRDLCLYIEGTPYADMFD